MFIPAKILVLEGIPRLAHSRTGRRRLPRDSDMRRRWEACFGVQREDDGHGSDGETVLSLVFLSVWCVDAEPSSVECEFHGFGRGISHAN